MPVVKQVTLYSFDELSPEAQQKAIDAAIKAIQEKG